MPNNADDFARDLAKQLETVQKAGSELHRTIALDLLTRLVNRSPVGNRQLWKVNQGKPRNNLQPKGYVGGHLRHNWQVTIDRTTDTEIDGNTRSPATVIRREQRTVTGAPFGSVIFLQNPVPYATRVMEDGWSTQAPRGAFSLAIQEIRTQYNVGGSA